MLVRIFEANELLQNPDVNYRMNVTSIIEIIPSIQISDKRPISENRPFRTIVPVNQNHFGKTSHFGQSSLHVSFLTKIIFKIL